PSSTPMLRAAEYAALPCTAAIWHVASEPSAAACAALPTASSTGRSSSPSPLASARAPGCSESRIVFSPGADSAVAMMFSTPATRACATSIGSALAFPCSAFAIPISPKLRIVPREEGAEEFRILAPYRSAVPRSSGTSPPSKNSASARNPSSIEMPRSPSPLTWSSFTRRSRFSVIRVLISRRIRAMLIVSTISVTSFVGVRKERGRGGCSQKFLELIIEPEPGHGEARHLHGGRELSDVRAEDRDAALREALVHGAVHDQLLLERGRAQPVDHHADRVLGAERHVLEDSGDQEVRDLVGAHHLAHLDAGLAVDPHAYLDLVLRNGEARLPHLRHDARGQGDAHGADVFQRLLGHRGHLVQGHPRSGGGAGDLVGVHQ